MFFRMLFCEKKTYAFFVSSLFLIVILNNAFAISRRHDVNDQRYIRLALNYPCVGRFLNGFSNASGVLIASQWVLTASHNLMFQTAPFAFEIGGGVYHIDWSKRHFAELPTPYSADVTLDIALVHLDRQVANVPPTQLYTEDNELGMEAIIVGFGVKGDGLKGVPTKGSQEHKRAGKNIIDAIGNFDGTNVVIDSSGKTLFYDFDNPDHIKEAKNWFGGSNRPLALEGMMASGDSGGGVFIESSGERKLIGISSGVYPGNSAGSSHRYGILSRIVRISAFNDWIHATIAKFESKNEPFHGLVAHWNFDDLNKGFAQDVSGAGHRGQIVYAGPTDGVIGGAIVFNDLPEKLRTLMTKKGYVEVPNKTSPWGGVIANDLKFAKDITIALWIYRAHPENSNGLPAPNIETIVTKGSISDGSHDFLFAITENRFRFYGNGKNYAQSHAHNIVPNTWQHIVVTRANDIVMFYVNGLLIGEDPLVGDIPISDKPLIIGNFPGFGFHFIDKMDDLRIYNRSLDQKEVTLLADVESFNTNIIE